MAIALSCAPAPPPCPSVAPIVSSDKASSPGAASAAPAVAGASHASPMAQAYGADVKRIIEAARKKPAAYEKLRELTDGVGHRLSGSKSLELAVDWAKKRLEADGHQNVRAEKVMVPHWERGQESASIESPVKRPLAILGLGGTVGTKQGGITGEVLVVRSYEELERAGAKVKDKIVLFDVQMRAHDEEKGSGYGDAVTFRASGPSRAAKLGAKAVLVRSLATASLSTPHTGATRFDDGVVKIPAAAIATEDAALLARLAEKGAVSVRLSLGAKQHKDAASANVVAELVGKEKPDEIVLIGAHLDSWDIGQGAHDDGAGCVIMMQALTTLRTLGLVPRRTIRVVLFTNEENGLAGAKAYAADHAAEVSKHVLGIEADSGGFAPWGFNVEVPKEHEGRATERVKAIADLLGPAFTLKVAAHGSGADLIPLVKAGVPGVGYVTQGAKYFDYHHSAADTLDKVDANELADGVAVVAAFAYVVADMPETILPR
ncbi:MAG: M20/M25/M40 family metallo-hydrolase [Polyangiaceae bacterium]|nr:M20/M25/M40 family metallo-hydrolase [Polyangiaceae bacterium]